MIEQNLQKLIMVGVSQLRTTTIFRNNVGMGWIGKSKRISTPTTVKLMPGDVIINDYEGGIIDKRETMRLFGEYTGRIMEIFWKNAKLKAKEELT